MATFDDAARIALGLPEVTEAESRGQRSWSVGGKAFAWERPFSKADLRDALVDAWLTRAPADLAARYLDRDG